MTDWGGAEVITFYSYKGGAGRSMQLVNVAWILASNGKRVLMVDWDLEAPGLHRYLRPFLVDKDLIATDGLIDLIWGFTDAAMTPVPEIERAQGWHEGFADLSPYITAVCWSFPQPGRLDLLPAGRQGPSYSRSVNSFNWQNFYDRLGGGVFLEAVKARMRREYDYVLIDSRTGVSDTAGICTVQMPDTLVVCFTPNNQSIEGCSSIVKSVQRQWAADGRSPGLQRVLPVLTRVDDSEKDKLDARRAFARATFDSPYVASIAPNSIDEYWRDIEVPYVPWYSYEEVIAAFADKYKEKGSILDSAEALTRMLTAGKVTAVLRPSDADRARVLAQFAAVQSAVPETVVKRVPEVAIPSPYPGMSPFSIENALMFFGREAEVNDIIGRLRAGEREIYIIGPSGSGKSSLVTAGLLPRLQRGVSGLERFLIRTLRPGEHPATGLSKVLEGDLSRPTTAIEALLSRCAPGTSVLLVVDQLEELFTLPSDEECKIFMSALGALRGERRCVLLFTLRADLYSTFIESPLWADLDGRLSRIDVTPLRGMALRAAIEQPARELGVFFEPELVERLLGDVASEPGVLPLLQETLTLLWDLRPVPRLTLADYEALGDGDRSGFAVAIAVRADATLRTLTVAQQRIARRILLRLVTFGEGRPDMRRRQKIKALRSVADDKAEFVRVLECLIEGRVITVDGADEGDESVADLSHEGLILAWPSLRIWLTETRADEEQRRRLEAKVSEWIERGRGAASLLDAVELTEAMQWMESDAARELGYGTELRSLVVASRRENWKIAWRAQERAEKSLFGSAVPAKLGRYVLLERNTGDSMGVVYGAYDPELRRKFTLKVLHSSRQPDKHAHERLIAEARALSKLDHPNVVKVHDVIMQDDQVVVVMEWVEGDTLAVWERKKSRSWRDIVAVYSQAGQGLAAAHGVGIVHRDFKPSSAIVGDDGLVRVLGFGLAGLTGPEDGPLPDLGEEAVLSQASPEDNGSMMSLTASGDIVGTLAYASPEQIAGKLVTPASDQFSFGVSMHRALEGVPPFVGTDAEGLALSIRLQKVALASDTHAPPKWLRSVVSRTLTEEPAERFPSMPALLSELSRPRGWRRWRTPVIIGVLVVVALSALIIGPSVSDPLADCDAGTSKIGAVWNIAARVRVGAALGSFATPDPDEIRARVLRGVDDYRDSWVRRYRGACVAHKNEETSSTLFERITLCMEERLGDFQATVEVLERLEVTSLDNAVDVVARAPRVADCAIASLLAETASPAAMQRSAVDAVRSRISRAMALERGGSSVAALRFANTAIEEAERTAYAPILADAVLTQGRILMDRRDFASAIASFARARTVALEQRQFSVAVEAAARELYLQAMSGDLNAAKRDADLFVSLSKGLRGDYFARPLLLNNVGTVYMAAGNRVEAARYFQEAHVALADIAAPDLELVSIDENLAMVTPDADTRETLTRGVCERLRGELGESHLATLNACGAYARYLRQPSTILPVISHVCDTYRRFHPEIIEPLVDCESYRAFLSGEIGEHYEELRIYDEIVSIVAGSGNDAMATSAALAAGYAKLLRGDGTGAAATLAKVVESASRSDHWWERVRAGDAELGIGLAERSLGHQKLAISHLEHALTIYNDVVKLNNATEYRLKTALAQRELDALRRELGPSGVNP